MKKFIEIKAENNKGVIVSNRVEVTDKQLKTIEPVIRAINAFKPYTTKEFWTHTHNFPIGKSINVEQEELSAEDLYLKTKKVKKKCFKEFISLCPINEDGIHTITDVDVTYGEKLI